MVGIIKLYTKSHFLLSESAQQLLPMFLFSKWAPYALVSRRRSLSLMCAGLWFGHSLVWNLFKWTAG